MKLLERFRTLGKLGKRRPHFKDGEITDVHGMVTG